MRVLVALDKFKEALPADAACDAVAVGLRARHPDWTLDLCPLADGGDGFVAALAGAVRAETRFTEVTGPLGAPLRAAWALVPAATVPAPARSRLGLGTAPLALLEMAACSGLALVPPGRRDVWRSSSRGVGELLREASLAGAGAILLGVGGSATNDLGLGALHALGWRALDGAGAEVAPPLPARWREIASFAPPPDTAGCLPPVWIACDVDNPLCGPHGATFAYGPQKGLAPGDLATLDAEMRRLAALIADAAGANASLHERPGAGAAGGIAGALMTALGARLVRGFDVVSEWLGLPGRVRAADLVITGEGGFDETSLSGKGPGALARLALEMKKPAWVFAGQIAVAKPPKGLRLVRITPEDMPRAEALRSTPRLLEEAARQEFQRGSYQT